jgi:hypothetical protein
MSARRLTSLLASLASLLAGGCCSTTEDLVSVRRTLEDRDTPCEEICGRLIDPSTRDRDYELVGCEEGLGEDGEPAVFCIVEVTHCTRELH